MSELLDVFAEAGASPASVQKFLEGELLRGGGSIRDYIAADMANQLLEALGQRPDQRPGQVKRLRERGTWRMYDRPPE